MPILIVEKGPEQGQTVDLQLGCRWIFGRDESCDFSTQDHSCSRRHFGIVEKNGRFIVKDLKSTHGTSVNGNALEVKELKDGDTIVAGETVFSFGVEKESGSGRGLVGKTIAGYQVFERIGRGGMGTVFRAKQVALDRDVALKVLSARYSNDKTFINRFFKEAQAAARLNNPNVVQVFDVREEKGLYLISLEMMDGGTVQDLATKEGQLPISRVLEIAREAAKGLAYAEKKHIVHGDIKPDNLMMNQDGHIKISDLGLARDVGEIAHQGEEGVFGTPHFISPEQAQGKAVDSRSDIYSLGATIYRLIAGTTPFSGASVREIILKQINDQPPTLKEVRSDCPEDLADLVSVMMAKDAEDRFESAAALQTAIESLGDTGSLDAQSGVGKKIGIIAGLVVVLAVVAFVLKGKNEDQPVVNPNNGQNLPQKPTAEEIAEAAKQAKERLGLEVRGLRATAELTLAGFVGNGKGEDLPSLNKVLGQLETAFAAGPETEEGKLVKQKIDSLTKKIKSIQAASATATAEAAEKRKRDDKAFEDLQTEIDASVKSRQFSKALASLVGISEELKTSHRGADLAPLKISVMDALESSCKEFESEVSAKLQTGDFAAAKELAKTFRSDLKSGSSADGIDDRLKIFMARITAKENEVTSSETAKREADRKLDQSTVYLALRPYYEKFGSNFDLESKKAKIDSVSSSLQTKIFEPRVSRITEALSECFALRQALFDQIKDAPGSISTQSGSRDIPAGKIVEINATEMVIEKRSGKKETVAWSKLEADILFQTLFRRYEANIKIRISLAAWLVECLLIDEASEIIDEVRGNLAGSPDDVKNRFLTVEAELNKERVARQIMQDVRQMREDADKSTTVGHWTRIKDKLDAFLKQHRGTRTYLLNSNGTSPLE
ncbi:MAG: serine/threonine protein kinase [Planctomycetota bacterium]|jgi:serine/threonine protein kinase